ncbi:hypothetical protein FAZ69_01265 [Trinickia terrae]|uniref:Cupin n=1 Tax=Trinickia terrae TaxID=2571161 RepID=A0A4U1IF91_9BURK|nr:hypothetical protein [Trinickia terrae]TKC92342.1 hypothetical protein FAZ69_01265 [Trinickia terrae]
MYEKTWRPVFFMPIFVAGILLAEGGTASDVQAAVPGVTVTPLAHTTHSWDGGQYTHYPQGVPLVDVQRVYIPAHTVPPWHTHAVVNAVYLLSGVEGLPLRTLVKN